MPAARSRSNFSGERVVPATKASPCDQPGKGAAGIAGAEDEEARASCRRSACGAGAPVAAFHSARTSPSASIGNVLLGQRVEGRCPATAATAPRPPRRAPAATGRRAARGKRPASAASPELPAAISTLRTKRSRPMRLTGEPANSARKPASSSASRSASAGCAQIVAGGELRLRRGLRRTCSRGRRRGSRRSHRCGCRSPRGIRAGSAPCSRW